MSYNIVRGVDMAKRYLATVLFSFGITVFACTFISADLLLYFLPIPILVAILFALIPNQYRITIASCAVASAFALVLSFVSFKPVADLEKQLLSNESTSFCGEVVDIGRNSAGTLSKYVVSLDKVDDVSLSWFDRVNVSIYCDESNAGFEVGQQISGKVTFFDSPVEFGYGREDRLILNAFYDGKEPLSVDGTDTLASGFYQFRSMVRDRLQYGDDDTIGMLKSVCFGDKNSLDSDMNVSLKRIGLSHVMAVSGLHLSFTLFLFYFILIAFRVNYRIRYALGIPVAIAFTALVGFPLSCVRACIMLVLFSLAMSLNLFPDSLTSLSLAPLLIILVNPYAVRDVGFLLSVAATAGIVIFSSRVENFLFPKKIGENPMVIKLYRKLTSAFSCSVAASVLTAPITIVSFKTFSLIAPFANLILIFPIQFMFVFGILMILFGWIPGVGVVIGWICDLLYCIIDFVANLLGRISFASVSGVSFFGIVLMVLLALITAVSIYDFAKHKRRTFFALFAIFLCFSACFGGIRYFVKQTNQIKIAFIDVGQGDCTVISKGDSAVIIDCGGSSDKRYNVNEYLNENGLYIVERLMFTHQHDDHINGLNSLLKTTYVDEILYSDLGFDSPELELLMVDQNVELINKSQCISVLEDVRVEIIAEPALEKTARDANERCVCYRVTYGDCSVLITGDLSGEAELKWLSDVEDCTILRVGHHGSDTSSMYPFLKGVAPEIAVVSVGENSYGLPDETVLSRLGTICDSVLLTQNEGNICYQTDGTVLERING